MPATRTTRQPDASATRYSSSADLPTPASPHITDGRALPAPHRGQQMIEPPALGPPTAQPAPGSASDDRLTPISGSLATAPHLLDVVHRRSTQRRVLTPDTACRSGSAQLGISVVRNDERATHIGVPDREAASRSR